MLMGVSARIDVCRVLLGVRVCALKYSCIDWIQLAATTSLVNRRGALVCPLLAATRLQVALGCCRRSKIQV